MSALTLRIIACVAMLLDHIGFLCDITVFRVIGRISFPIFLYLIYNGYKHTSSRPRYALRLGIFALVSQIPFSLFCYDTLFYGKGNVFVTLCLCLLAIWAADALRSRRGLKWLAPLPFVILLALYFFGVLQSDYGIKAVLMSAVFMLFDGKDVPRRILLSLGMFCSVYYSVIFSLIDWIVNAVKGTPILIPAFEGWTLVQIFSLCSLFFIFSYNGQKGGDRLPQRAKKPVQYGFYVFYPVHMLLLYLARVIFM